MTFCLITIYIPAFAGMTENPAEVVIPAKAGILSIQDVYSRLSMN